MFVHLYLLVLLPSVLGQCTVEKAVPLLGRAMYQFSIDLTQKLGNDTQNHFVASPLSLWTILSAVSLGADSTTLMESDQTLHLNHLNCFNMKYLEIVKEITSATDETTLERSSAVFIDKNILVHEQYQRRLKRTGVCDIRMLAFENVQIAASTINDYVSHGTHDQIQEIVSSKDIEAAFVILVDAIYFKGAWRYSFYVPRTEKNPFYDESGNHAGYVNMMHGVISLQTTAMDLIKAKVLELPYGYKRKFSMLIFLPYSNSSVVDVMELLKRVTIRSIFKSLSEYPRGSVDVSIPRFTISSDLDNLKELLKDMGLMTMFDSSRAQFPYISDYNLYVSDVLQKAEINVTEEGTIASAASTLEMTSDDLPEQFVANKPFLFMIVDKQFNIPLFTGAYSKPALF